MDNEHRSTGHMSGSHGLSSPSERNTKLCIIVEVGARGVPLGTSRCLYFSQFLDIYIHNDSAPGSKSRTNDLPELLCSSGAQSVTINPDAAVLNKPTT